MHRPARRHSGKRETGMIAVLVQLGSLCAVPDLAAEFRAGSDAYHQGHYAEAVDHYEAVAAAGVENAALFYNLGNAYFQLERFGAAIANYERALHLAPHFDAARTNRAQALAALSRPAAQSEPPAWEQVVLFWHHRLSKDAVWWLAALAWVAGWALLTVRLYRPWPYLRRGAGILIACSVVFGVSAWNKAHPPMSGVASLPSVQAHYSKDPDTPVRFTLREGDRVRIDRIDDGWMRVESPDGELGWTPAGSVTLTGPPYGRPRFDDTGRANGRAA